MFRFDRSPEFFDRLPAKKGTATHADALGCQPLSTNPERKLNWLDPTSIWPYVKYEANKSVAFVPNLEYLFGRTAPAGSC